jgi:hypothetical protein
LENWQQRLHEVSTRRCTRIDRTVRWVGTEIREPPSFHGVNDLEEFLTKYEDEVLENQRLLSLDIALKETPARWWGAHKETIKDWYQCKRLLRIRFGAEQGSNKMQRDMMDKDTNRTLGEVQNTMEDDTTRGMASSLHPHIGRNSRKLVCRPGTAQRHYRMDNITTNFIVTFSFEHENPNIDSTLKQIRGVIFIDEPEVELMTEYQQQNRQTVKELLSCYHVEEEAPDEDDPHNIHITEIEGEREVEGPSLESEVFVAPIKVKKVNIGTTDNPKMASIGDYWDEQTVERITELLREYSDLFPTTFTEMKGIAGELGEMKIPLKPEARSVRQRPYRLNPIYKQKVKEEIDRMLEAGIIEPVEESEWISPMVVQEKKQGGIRICVDLRKLNDAFLHDPFPYPFHR